MKHTYYVYILTNYTRTVVYTGVTNDLPRRLLDHIEERNHGFSWKYKCKYLIYYERFQYIKDAIAREKEIKKWRREKKDNLINKFNPERKSLNDHFI
jgi:putative endonuclease